MKTYKIFPILAFIALIMMGCNAYTGIYATQEPTTDFTKYKTFAWLDDKADTVNSPYNNEIIRNNMRNYFSKEMSDRGYRVEVDNPDMLLELVVKNTPHTVKYRTYNDQYYYRPYYYRSVYYSPYRNRYYYVTQPRYVYAVPPYYNSTTTHKETHIDNSVTLNIVDAQAKQLIWTGTVEADIYDPSVIKRDIHPAIEKLMKKFPVKPIVQGVAMQ
jgi:Domain of unknown function (DUF4136)